MVHRQRFLLAQFLWTVLLLAGITSRLPAQEQSLGSASEDAQSRDKTVEVVSLPEITGKATPTTELQAPDLEQLLNHLEAFRKAHTPFHIWHREVIKVRNVSEVKVIESMGLPLGMLLDTEYESAFWDNRSWKRCLTRGVDGELASDKRSSGDREGTEGLDVPFALLGVFIEPKSENCQLAFDDIYPHITITDDQHKGHNELWMFPVSGQWIPKRIRSTPEDEEEPIVEWEVKHIKTFGKDRPPQIIDGEVRFTVRDGDQPATITTEFFITKGLYGNKVVPSDIDPSLATMPSPLAAATNPAQEPQPRIQDDQEKAQIPITPTVEALTAALKNCEGYVLMMGERNILLPNLHTVDDAVLARRILNEVDGNKAIELFTQGSDIVIRTPQKDFAKPEIHDGMRFTRTIMEAQEHPKAASAQSDVRETPATVRIYPLKHVGAANPARIVEQLYGSVISVAVDEKTNSLILRGADDVSEEVQALLTELDNAAGSTQSGSSPTLPAAELKGKNDSLNRLEFRGVPNSDPNVISFYVGTTGETVRKLREQYHAFEQRAKDLSEEFQKPPADPTKSKMLKAQLLDTVRQAFAARQKLQRAELAEFARRLNEIRETVEMREKISRQIIERRVEEMLNPALDWDSNEDSNKAKSRGTTKVASPVGDPVVEAVVYSRDERGVVEISVGVDDGIRPGTLFDVHNRQATVGQIEVVAVNDHASVARILNEKAERPIRKGDLATNSVPWVTPQSVSKDHPGPVILDDLQGNWRLIMTEQSTDEQEGGKIERQVGEATIRGKRLTASTNPIQAADNQDKIANSPMRMILHLDGVGDPQPVDLEYVLEASEAAELKESLDSYPLRNGKPIALGIIERHGDGFRICIEHSKIVGRPQAFELGETAIFWELQPIERSDSEVVLTPEVETIVKGLEETNAAIRNLSLTTDYVKRQRFLLPFDSTLEMKLTTKAVIDSNGRSKNETDGQQVNIEPDGKSVRTYRGRWVGVFQDGVARQLTSYEDNPPSASIDSVLSWHGIDPREFTTHFQHKSVPEIIRSRGAQIADRTEWEGRPVTIVETTPIGEKDQRRYRFWIDTERNLVVRRAIVVRFADGQPWQEYARIESRDHQEVTPGIWLPMKVKYESVDVTAELKPEQLSWSYEGTNRDWQVNRDLPGDTFDLAFPEGSPVNDHRPMPVEKKEVGSQGSR